MPLTPTEQNYLKAVWTGQHGRPEAEHITQAGLARGQGHSVPAAHKVIHKLMDKGLVAAGPGGGLALSAAGMAQALTLVRRHRLWEVFLVDKLGYDWSLVHELAEELEHVGNAELTDRLEQFLNYPRYDPHGDPIPDREGQVERTAYLPLSECRVGARVAVVGVREQSKSFFEFLQDYGLGLSTELEVLKKLSFDGSLLLALSGAPAGTPPIHLSSFAADHLIVVER